MTLEEMQEESWNKLKNYSKALDDLFKKELFEIIADTYYAAREDGFDRGYNCGFSDGLNGGE